MKCRKCFVDLIDEVCPTCNNEWRGPKSSSQTRRESDARKRAQDLTQRRRWIHKSNVDLFDQAVELLQKPNIQSLGVRLE